jgi:hypothetical protein
LKSIVDKLNSNLKNRFSFVIVFGIILIVVIVGILQYYSVLSNGQLNLKQSNPFEPTEQPPKIVMVYNGKEYNGGLVGYSWEKTEVLGEIPEINGNITASLPEAPPQVIKVENNTSVKFKVEYINQTDALPDALSVNVYGIDALLIIINIMNSFTLSDVIIYIFST